MRNFLFVQLAPSARRENLLTCFCLINMFEQKKKLEIFIVSCKWDAFEVFVCCEKLVDLNKIHEILHWWRKGKKNRKKLVRRIYFNLKIRFMKCHLLHVESTLPTTAYGSFFLFRSFPFLFFFSRENIQ